MYPWILCLTLAVSLRLPLTPSLAPAGCASVAESRVQTLLVPLLESSGAKDSRLSANPGGARGFFLLGALPHGTRKTPDSPSSGMSGTCLDGTAALHQPLEIISIHAMLCLLQGASQQLDRIFRSEI